MRQKGRTMATTWGNCPELDKVVRKLLAETTRHTALKDVTILCDKRDDRPKEPNTSNERHWQVTKAAGQQALRIRGGQSDKPLFLCSVPEWTLTELPPDDFEAMVDEMLCGMDVGRNPEGEMILKKRGPDARIYTKNAEIYGMWHGRLKQAAKALLSRSQLSLALGEEIDADEAAAQMPDPDEASAEERAAALTAAETLSQAEGAAEGEEAVETPQDAPQAPSRKRTRPAVSPEMLREGFSGDAPPVVS